MGDNDSPLINKLLGWIGKLFLLMFAACTVFVPIMRETVLTFLERIGYSYILPVLILLILALIWISLLCFKFYRLYIEAKRPKDYHDFLKPLQGQGLCIDTRNNEVVCPSCNRDGVLSYMRKMDHYEYGKRNKPIYLCFACMKAVPEQND